jgi:hypothetical protein
MPVSLRKYIVTLNFLGHWPLTGWNMCILFLRLSLQSPEKRKWTTLLVTHFLRDNRHYITSTTVLLNISLISDRSAPLLWGLYHTGNLLVKGVYSSYFPHYTTYCISQKSHNADL